MTRPREAAAGAWRYRRPASEALVEWGDVHGRAVALPVHFHDEDQVTFVLAGRRRFRIGDAVVTLGPGEALALPAGLPHASLDEPDGVACRNAYLPAGSVALTDLVEALSGLRHRHGAWDEADVVALVREHRLGTPAAAAPAPGFPGGIGRAAARSGMTREAFSRAFRRRHGLPPQVFSGLARLNAARALLRDGLAPAAVAADTGFSDQSHLGRRFRRTFGVTPGRYRAG